MRSWLPWPWGAAARDGDAGDLAAGGHHHHHLDIERHEQQQVDVETGSASSEQHWPPGLPVEEPVHVEDDPDAEMAPAPTTQEEPPVAEEEDAGSSSESDSGAGTGGSRRRRSSHQARKPRRRRRGSGGPSLFMVLAPAVILLAIMALVWRRGSRSRRAGAGSWIDDAPRASPPPGASPQ